MFLALKNSAATGYEGSVLLKGAGLLFISIRRRTLTLIYYFNQTLKSLLITLCTGLIEDGVATMKWIRSQSPNVPLYIWGHSLGSG